MTRKTRLTTQKEALDKELATIKGIYSAHEILEKVRKTSPKIGIATVYRHLNEAAKKDKLHTFICNRRTVYTSSSNTHCHFTCTDCKETKHFAIEKADFLQHIPGHACHIQLDVQGTCDKCLNNKNN